MSKLNIITRSVLWVLLAASLVVLLMFWFGGTNTVELPSGSYDGVPLFTETLLQWAYVLFGLSIAITVIVSVVAFIMNFIAKPMRGIATLAVLVLFAGVFLVSWNMGSSETLEIIGYNGTDNTGFMAQFSDMCIYSMYTLGGAVILSLFGSVIYAKLF